MASAFDINLYLADVAEFGTERAVHDDHLFEFTDQDIGPDPLRFLAQIDGRWLPPGETYLTFLNPYAPDALYLCDARHRYLGACAPWTTCTKGDLDAIHRQCGRAAQLEADLLQPVARAGAALSRRRLEDAQHNADLLEDAAPAVPPASPADSEAARLAQLADEALAQNSKNLYP